METQLQVGKIVTTHGLKGEVKVYPTTDDPHRFELLKTVILDTGRTQLTLEPEKVRYFKNLVILKFKGLDSIEDVEKYKGASLLVNREDAVDLEEDEYFLADIMGMQVYTDEGEYLGEIYDVLQTPANDVYVIRTEAGKEILFPAVKEYVPEINFDEEKIIVHLIPGIL